MNGITNQGVVLKGNMPASPSVETVPSADNLRGQTAPVTSKKSSETAGFSASKKAGSIKGDCC